MPLIEVKLIEGVFSPQQKQEMVTRLTDTMVSIEGENMRGVTVVLIEEVKSGDWGIGGKSLSTADVKALAAGKPTGQSSVTPSRRRRREETTTNSSRGRVGLHPGPSGRSSADGRRARRPAR